MGRNPLERELQRFSLKAITGNDIVDKEYALDPLAMTHKNNIIGFYLLNSVISLGREIGRLQILCCGCSIVEVIVTYKFSARLTSPRDGGKGIGGIQPDICIQ